MEKNRGKHLRVNGIQNLHTQPIELELNVYAWAVQRRYYCQMPDFLRGRTMLHFPDLVILQFHITFSTCDVRSNVKCKS